MRDTFVAVGTMGLSLLVALIGTPMSELATVIAAYQAAWRAAGHPGQGEVRLRLPIYVADTLHQAQADPHPGVMAYYERLRQGYLRSSQRFESGERTTRAAQLATLTYTEVLQERVVFGTPGQVAQRLRTLRQALGLSGIIIESNAGGGISPTLVARSMELFAQEVAPQLREEA
jgi:alkanesulfonate monooxygenase SsuD/methylene tetrahydromethanopterin reductase-like flavin-dependent oxidoreductase (luciferase family)